VKATIALIVLWAACGQVARAPAPAIANHAPPEIDAGAPSADIDAADEECTAGDPITVRVAGRDDTARIETCVGTEEHHHGEDWVSQDARAELVLDRGDGGDPVTVELAQWETNMEDTLRVTLIGALRSASGEEAVVIENDSSGPGEGLSGDGAALIVYAVRGDAWEKVHEVDSNVIEATISKDRRVATVETCAMNDAGPGNGSGGGACHFDGDGKTIELRWDGERVDETDVSAAP
jgi:hypothetical protein